MLYFPWPTQGYIYPGRIDSSCWAGLPLSSRAERGATPLTFLHAFAGPAPNHHYKALVITPKRPGASEASRTLARGAAPRRGRTGGCWVGSGG